VAFGQGTIDYKLGWSIMAILCTAIHIYDRDRLMIFFYYPTFK